MISKFRKLVSRFTDKAEQSVANAFSLPKKPSGLVREFKTRYDNLGQLTGFDPFLNEDRLTLRISLKWNGQMRQYRYKVPVMGRAIVTLNEMVFEYVGMRGQQLSDYWDKAPDVSDHFKPVEISDEERERKTAAVAALDLIQEIGGISRTQAYRVSHELLSTVAIEDVGASLLESWIERYFEDPVAAGEEVQAYRRRFTSGEAPPIWSSDMPEAQDVSVGVQATVGTSSTTSPPPNPELDLTGCTAEEAIQLLEEAGYDFHTTKKLSEDPTE